MKKQIFFFKKLPISFENTFLHKPYKFEQKRSSGDTRKILITARGLAENGLPEITT